MKRELVRRLGVATAISLAAHALVLAGGWLELPKADPVMPPLEARIVSIPPPAPPPAAKPKPAPRPKPKVKKRIAAPAPPPLSAPVMSEPSPLVLPQEPEPPADAPAPEPAPESADRPDEVALAAQGAPEPSPLPRLPAKGRISYTLYLGEDRFSVGRTTQSWEVEGGTYRLGSFSETTGIVDLFRAQRLNYMSKGAITPQGLKPETFLMSRTRRGRTEEARARFDWAAGTILLGKTGEQRAEPLPAAAQDIVSFIYQLALAPPAPGRIRLPITNGARIETYELDVLPEEEIQTPLGALRALPVKQVRRDNDESIEVWLAPDYRHLPVRIRFYDKDGKPAGEQVVDEIKISD